MADQKHCTNCGCFITNTEDQTPCESCEKIFCDDCCKDTCEGVLCVKCRKDPEQCPNREDKTHCCHWWDGGKCCACDSPAMSREQMVESGMVASDGNCGNCKWFRRNEVRKPVGECTHIDAHYTVDSIVDATSVCVNHEEQV